MTSLLRRVLLAMECDERAESRAFAAAGPVASCAGLGAMVGHVVATLLRDRRRLTSWLDDRMRTAA
jgi:hypothetical protein